jgi:hypothetical protein
VTRIGLVAGVIIIVIASVFFGFRKAMRAADTEAAADKPTAERPPAMSAPAARPTAKGTPLENARPLRRIDPESRKLLVEELAKARAKRTPVPVAGAPALPAQELSAEYILTQTQAILPLLKECYTEAQQDDPTLAGELSLEIVIGGEPDVGGLVESSEILEGSTIKHAAMLECVRETMYGLELVAPAEGGRYTVRTRMAFSPEPSGSSSR